MKTVPEAIIAFLESESFEDAIRNAISLGGDSDTLAAITGSIAEAACGIPEEIRAKAYSYLDEPLKDVIRRWERYSKRSYIETKVQHLNGCCSSFCAQCPLFPGVELLICI